MNTTEDTLVVLDLWPLQSFALCPQKKRRVQAANPQETANSAEKKTSRGRRVRSFQRKMSGLQLCVARILTTVDRWHVEPDAITAPYGTQKNAQHFSGV